MRQHRWSSVQTSLIVALFGSVALGPAAWSAAAPYEAQPAGEHSTLVTHGGGAIRDDDFAKMIGDLLLKSGISNVRDAKFLFEECYGGGMLDDIDAKLGDKVKWVGGSASKHNEPSYGQPDSVAGAMDSWTKALAPEMKKDQTLRSAIDKAREGDIYGPNAATAALKLENPQGIDRNGGDTIKLKDAGAASHHAILWAGDPDGARHYNDIVKVREALIDQWGAPNGTTVTITTLFGDGAKNSAGANLPAGWNAKEATAANLKAAIDALKDGTDPDLNTNEQFLFYASDHGGWAKDVKPKDTEPVHVPTGGKDIESFTIPFSVLASLLNDPDNIETMQFEYVAVLGMGASVYLNGHLLGLLDSLSGVELFTIDESWLQESNSILVDNQTGPSFDLLAKLFYSGDIDTVAVPEPGTLTLLFGGLVALMLRRRGRGSPH